MIRDPGQIIMTALKGLPVMTRFSVITKGRKGRKQNIGISRVNDAQNALSPLAKAVCSREKNLEWPQQSRMTSGRSFIKESQRIVYAASQISS